ncbi:MAG: thiamine pyrophosphate-dependent dehydrogenase E1 component subunit alpha, partial [Chloroflexi bacterium]|nr:thiamine pyrophosphate-dependent dehydrogenase E1 component subunit alpha [Chloroflexota bacterium]
MNIDRKTLLDMYRTMVTIRRFSEAVVKVSYSGEVATGVHVAIGQEAVAAGVCAHLRRDDQVVTTHRGHGHMIAKGSDTKLMMAELFGKKTGYCKGKGGEMHISDMSAGVIGSFAVVGEGLPVATGAALADQMRGTDSVAVCFFGDGAACQGTFHESLNLASIWKLPVVFVCENNMYAIFTPTSAVVSVTNIADRAAGYSMPGVIVDGQDVMAVFEAAEKAVRRARAGEGPTLLECKTYRYAGHEGADDSWLSAHPYRSAEELAAWKKRDPIALFEARLLEDKLVTGD